MCTSCDCKCKITLEVGKTYLWKDGTKIKIVCKDDCKYIGTPHPNHTHSSAYKDKYYAFKEDGTPAGTDHTKLVAEYKEPKFRYFPIWLKNANSNLMQGNETREQAMFAGERMAIQGSPFIAIGKVNQDTREITIEKI